ncbi:universal stress protein [Streptomyces antimycoticus]|uniref:universal stress protein n=1 Tax=Streptomyces antimycoticus TaxID=68175 RepID=UPI0037D62F6F
MKLSRPRAPAAPAHPVVGDAYRELARLTDDHQADARVLGTPEHRLHHLIGSVPVWKARHAHCPVVIALDRHRLRHLRITGGTSTLASPLPRAH